MSIGASGPIGVIDSGVGGLTVLHVLEKQFPKENFLYLGDTAHKTYGNRSIEEIIEFSQAMVDYLVKHNAKLIVIACNTITVTALEAIQANVDIPVIGMCRGVERAIASSKKHSIAVMGTVATINSHKHKNEADAIDTSIRFIEQPCADLARIIEEGHVKDSVAENTLHKYMDPLLSQDIDTIIFGCTHYPFVKEMMDTISGGNMQCIDPAFETAEVVATELIHHSLENQNADEGTVELCFTGDVNQASELASYLWKENIPLCKMVTIK